MQAWLWFFNWFVQLSLFLLFSSVVYRFRSRAPSTSVYCSGEGSLGLSRIPALREDGKSVDMLARSASYWVQQEPARCWVRDCTGLACSAGGHPSRTHLLQHHLLSEEDSLTSLIREEFLSVDEGDDGRTGNSRTPRSQADVTSDEAPRSFAEEYSLAPLNTRKKYSAQSFDQQVENYFKHLWASAHLFGIWEPNLLEMQMPVFICTIYSNTGWSLQQSHEGSNRVKPSILLLDWQTARKTKLECK